jgi:hypothetical protein
MFKLRTKPTQFVKGKTEDTLCDLIKRYALNTDDNKTHLLEIIVTNNSLPETEQWKFRTDKKFANYKNIVIDILSTKGKKYKKINDYICDFQECKKNVDRPNILIICYNNTRVCKDLLKIFNILGNINNIKFHISFDEPDANIKVTRDFIKLAKQYIDNNTIIGILFITATPIEAFWKMLNDSGIKTLLNMNRDNTQNFDEDMENYMSFKEHNIIEHENDTNNPLYYIINVFSNELINESVRKIIFAPAHLYTNTYGTGSHSEVASYFNDKGYCVFLMNSKFKGFIFPNNTKIELIKFNDENNVTGELRESLVKWSELNPTLNLAITGNCVIERGITFNTLGFNFTDAILSNYHSCSLNKLIQIAGRMTGNKDYVSKMNIICTRKVKEEVINFNKRLEQICSLNPEHFNRTDFTNSNNTIPVKITVNDIVMLELIIHIRDNARRGYKVQLHNIILEGIQNGKITILDKNNIKKFIITDRILKDVRMYKNGDDVESRRFKQFNDAFENYKNVSQTGDNTNYNIDMSKDIYVHNDFIHNRDILWVTYKYDV